VDALSWVESDEVVNAYSALGENEILRTLEKLGVQRAMVDTGAGKSLGPLSDNRLLSNKSKSNIRLKVAVGDNPIPGDSRGLLDMYVLGADITDQHITNCNSGMLFSPEFNTVKGLNCRLLSPHDLYDDNFDLHLVHFGFSGFINIMTKLHVPVYRVPSTRAWWLFYIAGKSNREATVISKKAEPLLQQLQSDQMHANYVSVADTVVHACYAEHDGAILTCEGCDFSGVDIDHLCGVFDDTEISAMFNETQLKRIAEDESFQFPGSKARVLGPAGRKFLSKQIHARFGHQGHHPDCRICNSVKKTTRRIPKDPDPIKAMPVGFGFGMDAFTFSVPNITGEKHAYIYKQLESKGRE
jgi:hypothetical protein